ncbi:glycine cleavage system protein H [Bremerella cremea]|uniref:Glycine cleavage system protein H n=1 Tax=Blastopirellula marina TaxID=124 RepID=A0A2S8FV52_9BACT|nr:MULTISPECIES: glycine cleavage system protein H [Pirellulaceae]PQO36061.1 glycine cleavage system protein H [Blastopirellula marina]RCS48738.1 glycine cleavage system protein H [Bremerella cremea]
MSESLVFMMGKFEATFPTDRQYSKNHLWATRSGNAFRFGFSAYAVRLLQDVYFLEWQVDEGATIKEGQEIGFIESSKAESDLYPPIAGVLARLNPDLMSDPSRINVDMYGEGWLYEIKGSGETLLSPQEYIEHLASVWDVTQRTIKGQLNE